MELSIEDNIKSLERIFDKIPYSELTKVTGNILKDIHQHCTWAYFRLDEDFDPRGWYMHNSFTFKFVIYFTTRLNEQKTAFEETMVVSEEKFSQLHLLVASRWEHIKNNESKRLGYALSYIARNGYAG